MVPLVVIDMQPIFLAADDDKLIKNIQRQILLAKRRHAWIFFIEWGPDYHWEDGCPTFCDLTDLTEDYDKVRVLEKYNNDGSPELVEQLNILQLKPRTLRLCGVCTDACVYATMSGLVDDYNGEFQVDLLMDCCNSTTSKKDAIGYVQEYVDRHPMGNQIRLVE